MKTPYFRAKSNYKFILLLILTLSILLVLPSQVMAARGSVQNFYIQVGLGAGLGLESYATGDPDASTGSNTAMHLTGRAHVGISNIMEVELQRQVASNSSNLKNYEFDFLLYKFNPFPADYNTESEPFYLVYGTGEFNYFTETGFGWQGDSQVVGMEWALMSYRRTYRVGIKHVTSTTNTGSTNNTKVEMILLEFGVAIGF